MPDHRKLLLISVLVFTALLFIDHFFIWESLPELIPETLNKISGLFLIICSWVEFYVVFKKILKQDDNNKISVSYLTAFGCLIVLFSQIIFQFYRQTTFSDVTNEDRIRIFLIGVLGFTIFAGILAFSIAVEVKYKKGWLTTLINISIGLLFYFASPYVLSYIKGE